MKKQTDMSTRKTKNNLTLVRAPQHDADGKSTVVTCGYAENGLFGYFICKERRSSGKDGLPLFEYSDFTEFHPKKDDKTFQAVLERFKVIVPTS